MVYINMEEAIEQALDWDRVLTKDGKTQQSERYYISVIIEQMKRMGANVGSNAATQQAVDIRDVEWPGGPILSYEGKKVNKGCRFLFNDTFLKPDVWYIFLYGHLKKVRIVKGSTLISESSFATIVPPPKEHLKKVGELVVTMLDKEPTPELVKKFFIESMDFIRSCVINGIFSYFDFGEIFKRSITFGNFVSRPRPNWALTIPYKPPQSREEGPHCQAGLSDPCRIPIGDSP